LIEDSRWRNRPGPHFDPDVAARAAAAKKQQGKQFRARVYAMLDEIIARSDDGKARPTRKSRSK
jgi:hypothetical protein